MKKPIWLTKQIVISIHASQIREHGGQYGIRDISLLDSALIRPVNRWLYQARQDYFSLAAAYGYGLARNHCFIDGNKRTAFMAMYTFLAQNNYEINAPEPMVVDVMTGVAEGSISEEQLTAWLREFTDPAYCDSVHE